MRTLPKYKQIFFILAAIMLVAGQFTRADVASDQATKDQLQQQLDAVQREIAAVEQQLNDIKGQKNTLQNKVNQLKKQQASLNLQIQEISLRINDLTGKISETQLGIEANTMKARLLQDQIGGVIRSIYERDSYPFLYSVVQRGNLSEVLDDVENYSAVSTGLRDLLGQARDTKVRLQEQEVLFTEQQDDARNLLSVQTLQQTKLAGTVSEQNELLQVTKGREQDYQITLNDTRRRAAEIRGRIYDLFGISSGEVTFGEALKLAQFASDATGLEPAFLLAVLTQESNLGKNVGTCNRYGDPPEKGYREIMKPDRDIKPFLEIIADLGMDPETTPVSCPMRDKRGKRIGWGGAMGPAQFIPSTWVGYKDKVTAITGKPANPWDIRDAFLAAAIKLKAGGADNTDQGEWNAAMRYFSGSLNKAYRFYGDNVLELTKKYRDDIAALGAQ